MIIDRKHYIKKKKEAIIELKLKRKRHSSNQSKQRIQKSLEYIINRAR